MAEAALDHPAVEELQRVARAEPECVLRVRKRRLAVSVAGEGPREDVVAVDRGPLRVGAARQGERVRETDSVVDVEERGLTVGPHRVRDEQPLYHADQRVLAARLAGPAGRAVQIA